MDAAMDLYLDETEYVWLISKWVIGTHCALDLLLVLLIGAFAMQLVELAHGMHPCYVALLLALSLPKATATKLHAFFEQQEKFLQAVVDEQEEEDQEEEQVHWEAQGQTQGQEEHSTAVVSLPPRRRSMGMGMRAEAAELTARNVERMVRSASMVSMARAGRGISTLTRRGEGSLERDEERGEEREAGAGEPLTRIFTESLR
eukprot:2899317-Rhodomonas_salina.2